MTVPPFGARRGGGTDDLSQQRHQFFGFGNEAIGAFRNSDRPLGVGANSQARDTQSGRLFLEPAGISDHGKGVLDQIEHLKASVRAKVEHPFRVIKRQFGHVKVRYRGLAKNTAQLHTLFALSNLWMVRAKLMALDGKVCPMNARAA